MLVTNTLTHHQFKLLAENNLYPPIVVKDGQELTVWGVVTHNLHKLY